MAAFTPEQLARYKQLTPEQQQQAIAAVQSGSNPARVLDVAEKQTANQITPDMIARYKQLDSGQKEQALSAYQAGNSDPLSSLKQGEQYQPPAPTAPSAPPAPLYTSPENPYASSFLQPTSPLGQTGGVPPIPADLQARFDKMGITPEQAQQMATGSRQGRDVGQMMGQFRQQQPQGMYGQQQGQFGQQRQQNPYGMGQTQFSGLGGMGFQPVGFGSSGQYPQMGQFGSLQGGQWGMPPTNQYGANAFGNQFDQQRQQPGQQQGMYGMNQNRYGSTPPGGYGMMPPSFMAPKTNMLAPPSSAIDPIRSLPAPVNPSPRLRM